LTSTLLILHLLVSILVRPNGRRILRREMKLMDLIKLRFGIHLLYLNSRNILKLMEDLGLLSKSVSDYITLMDQKLMMREESLMVGAQDLMNGYHFGAQRFRSFIVILNLKVARELVSMRILSLMMLVISQ